MGNALAGCNATALAPNHDDVVTVTTETAANPIHDGQYEVYGTCTWPGFDGVSPIIDGHNVWTIKKGALNHKKGRFNITGKVKGDSLSVSGQRQSGQDFGWYNLYFSGKLTNPAGSELKGSWKNGNCKVTLSKILQMVERDGPMLRTEY